MTNELEMIWQWNYSSICLERLWTTITNLSQDSKHPSWDMNWASLKCESRAWHTDCENNNRNIHTHTGWRSCPLPYTTSDLHITCSFLHVELTFSHSSRSLLAHQLTTCCTEFQEQVSDQLLEPLHVPSEGAALSNHRTDGAAAEGTLGPWHSHIPYQQEATTWSLLLPQLPPAIGVPVAHTPCVTANGTTTLIQHCYWYSQEAVGLNLSQRDWYSTATDTDERSWGLSSAKDQLLLLWVLMVFFSPSW